jgi:hypothetical protein
MLVLLTVTSLVAGCGVPESLEKSTENLSKFKPDVTGHTEAAARLEAANKRIKELEEQIRLIRANRSSVVTSAIVGTYKNEHGEQRKVQYNEKIDKYEFITSKTNIYHYVFDEKDCVFVCEELPKAEAYYFPNQGVIVFSGYDNEKPTYWKK